MESVGEWASVSPNVGVGGRASSCRESVSGRRGMEKLNRVKKFGAKFYDKNDTNNDIEK